MARICQLNWHRHWPDVGGRLTDCDLIYPGWSLRLPEDAVPPASATPANPTDSQPPSDSPTSDPSPCCRHAA